MRALVATAFVGFAFVAVGLPDPLQAATRSGKRKYYSTRLQAYAPQKYADHGLKDTLTERGRRARGFYITSHYLRRVGPERVAARMKRARMNTVVIDVKDDWGQVLYPSRVALARRALRRVIPDPAALVRKFHENGIYVIARVVCFKDSKLPLTRPDLGVRIGRRARRLMRAGAYWLDAYATEVQDYLIDIGLELEAFGFDEIQLDYVRFPKGSAGKWGRWLHEDGRDRTTVIANFLERADRALKTPLSADVYGLTTLVDGDPRRLGQTVELMAQYVEALSPMMYANGMASYFRGGVLTKGVYALIECGLWRARHKIGDTVLRPYLQSYPNAVPFFGPEFIVKQLQAADRAGAHGFLFWNSTMKNAVALGALRKLGSAALDAMGRGRALPSAERDKVRWCRKGPPSPGRRRIRRPSSAVPAARPHDSFSIGCRARR